MAQVAGLRTTLNIEQDRRVYDVEKRIFRLEPNQTPLTAILAQMQQRKIVNPRFHWHEDALLGRTTQADGAQAASLTTVTVDDTSIFAINDVVQVTQTGENMLVLTIPTSTTFTATRGLGGTSAAAITDNDEILNIGSTFAEGTVSADAVSTKVVPLFNFAQIFKASVNLTETEAISELRDEQDEAYQIQKKGIEFNRLREAAMLHGSRNEETISGKPRRQMGGLITQFITTNVTDNLGASLTRNILNNFFRPLFDNGDSDTRWVFGSATFMQAVSNIAETNLRTLQGDETFGLSVVEWITPFGRTFLKLHRELSGATFGNFALALDMNNIKRAVLRDVKLEMNVQANDADERKHQYISEESVQVVHETTHGILKNFAV